MKCLVTYLKLLPEKSKVAIPFLKLVWSNVPLYCLPWQWKSYIANHICQKNNFVSCFIYLCRHYILESELNTVSDESEVKSQLNFLHGWLIWRKCNFEGCDSISVLLIITCKLKQGWWVLLSWKYSRLIRVTVTQSDGLSVLYLGLAYHNMVTLSWNRAEMRVCFICKRHGG